MLILTRKYDQSIIIGSGTDYITIMVLGIERDRVQLGIDAPDNVGVWREEILTGDSNKPTSIRKHLRRRR